MLALVIFLIMAILVVAGLQRRHSKHTLLEEANMDNPKFREMIEESLLKQEVAFTHRSNYGSTKFPSLACF